jgi:hypothetical protein
VRTALKVTAALLFLVVTPRVLMGEVFEVVGAVHLGSSALTPERSDSVADPAGSAAASEAGDDSRSHRPKADSDGPTKPRFAIPRRRQLGQLAGTGLPTGQSGPETQGRQAGPVLVVGTDTPLAEARLLLKP